METKLTLRINQKLDKLLEEQKKKTASSGMTEEGGIYVEC